MLKIGDMMRVDRGTHAGLVGRLVQIRGDETFELEDRGAAIVPVPGRHCVAAEAPELLGRREEWFVRTAPLGRDEVVDRNGLLVARCDALDADLIAAAPSLLAMLLTRALTVEERAIVQRLVLPRETCDVCKGSREYDDDECLRCLGRGTIACVQQLGPVDLGPETGTPPKPKKRRRS